MPTFREGLSFALHKNKVWNRRRSSRSMLNAAADSRHLLAQPRSMAQQSPSTGGSEVARYAGLLAGLMVGLLAIRVLALKVNGTDLFFDEAQYWSWSLEPAFGYYSKPPLIAWIIGVSTTVCGVSEFCIRLPSPLIHAATAGLVFAIGRQLYDARTGFWSALVFATLPGVSFSAGIISTDVPLLFCWALALFGYVALTQQTRAWWPVVILGVGLGLGLNAKYAMAYIVLCIAVDLMATPERRRLLTDLRLWAAGTIGLMLIAPNLIWNASHSFATFAHTADNAKWTGSLVNPLKALEFFGTQFGVFGPILFGGLLVIVVRAYRDGLNSADRLLLAFAVPVIIIVTGQAFLSRAHANWAAVSYLAATVLVTATMIRDVSWGWLRASLALHVAVIAALALATATAGTVAVPGIGDPFARTLGWRTVANETAMILANARSAGRSFGSVITDERALSAELLFYMRDEPTPLLAWRTSAKPADHYELTRPFTNASKGPVLLVAMRRDASEITAKFGQIREIATKTLAAGRTSSRTIAFYELDDYRGR